MMAVPAWHRQRFARMLGDLQLTPSQLVPAPDGSAIRDDVAGRLLALQPANVTEAEGIVSAIKIAAALDPLLAHARALVDALVDEAANHGGLTSRDTLVKAGALQLELSRWGAP